MEPQQTPEFSQAPTSPEEVQGIPAESANPELSQEEMKSNLKGMMDKLTGKYQEFSTQKFTTDKQIKEQNSEILRQLFDLLESKGIDPSDPERVKQFLDSIKESNPEAYQQIEKALQMILGSEDVVSTPEQPEAVNPEVGTSENMNINPDETIQENI